MLRVAEAGVEYAMEPGAVWARVQAHTRSEPRPPHCAPGFQGGVSPHILIETDRGPVPAGDIVAGSMVRTLAHGFQPVLWAGRECRAATGSPQKTPVRFNAGAFGKSAQTGHVLLAPDQHLVLRHRMNELLFATQDVMCRARDLTHLPGISPAHGRLSAQWVHLLFDRLEVVRTEGLWLESFVPDMPALRRQDQAAARAVEQAVPALRYDAGLAAYAGNWMRLNGREIGLLDRDGFQV